MSKLTPIVAEGGLLLSIDTSNLEFPEDLKLFLSLDDQGMPGLEFMFKNERLSKKIPEEVIEQYNDLYNQLNTAITNYIETVRKRLQELENNPTPVIHKIIEDIRQQNK